MWHLQPQPIKENGRFLSGEMNLLTDITKRVLDVRAHSQVYPATSNQSLGRSY
jgi:hypothetical protein